MGWDGMGMGWDGMPVRVRAMMGAMLHVAGLGAVIGVGCSWWLLAVGCWLCCLARVIVVPNLYPCR